MTLTMFHEVVQFLQKSLLKRQVLGGLAQGLLFYFWEQLNQFLETQKIFQKLIFKIYTEIWHIRQKLIFLERVDRCLDFANFVC